MAAIRVLCTADIHIGRGSSGDLEITGDVSALAAWRRIVEVALQEKAHAVVIAGDLFEGLAAQYATRPIVRRVFESLRDGGIPALAVAGNHDHSALPAFAQSHPGLVHLFGAAAWSEYRTQALRFIGRSFAAESESDSLLKNLDLASADAPTIGLVHADIDARSRYGPTPLGDFADRGVAAWVVGHVHAPRVYQANQPVAYPGSPQALDWGETGIHGFRWLTIEHGQASFGPVVPLSSVRYEYVTIELGPGDSVETRLNDRSTEYRRDHHSLESVQFRVDVRLVNGAARPALADAPTTLDRDGYWIRSETIVPDVDLVSEARHVDARGQAARLLLGLQQRGDPLWREHALAVVERVRLSMETERRNLNLPTDEEFDSLRRGPPDEALNAVRRSLETVLTTDGRAG